MKKPISILDTAAYVEPYTFETVASARNSLIRKAKKQYNERK